MAMMIECLDSLAIVFSHEQYLNYNKNKKINR